MVRKIDLTEDGFMTEHDNNTVKLFTIGYAGKNAERFFTLLFKAGVKKVIDVRLYNTSQLAGFTKKDDLEYFLQAVAGIDYVHLPLMSPTKELLTGYKDGSISWAQYETRFDHMITQRQIEKHVNTQDLHMACLLCAEAKPDKCHRRLVAEYLAQHLQNILIEHL